MIETDNKVLVICRTYNQAGYIIDTLNGFCSQQTNFSFVCCIIDDASTDEESSVIHNYLEENFETSTKETTKDYKKCFAQNKTNRNCYFLVFFLNYNHYQLKKNVNDYIKEYRSKAKYIAYCEGDDYWCDPLKLQKQVDLMESHPNLSQCFTAHKCLYPDGTFKEEHRYEQDLIKCPIKDAILMGGGYMATPSVIYKRELRENLPEWYNNLPIGDLPTMLVLFERGDCGYINDVTAVYRVSAMGSWSNTMSANYEKKMHLYETIRKMWKEYDKWSRKKNHKWVKLKILRNDISKFHDQLLHFLNRK